MWTQHYQFRKISKVDLYASSFAGASGYPLFENYKDADKQKILIKQKNFTKIKKINLKMIKPKFLPYAGFLKKN